MGGDVADDWDWGGWGCGWGSWGWGWASWGSGAPVMSVGLLAGAAVGAGGGREGADAGEATGRAAAEDLEELPCERQSRKEQMRRQKSG